MLTISKKSAVGRDTKVFHTTDALGIPAVVIVDENGAQITSFGGTSVITDNPEPFEDTNFVVGDSPVLLDVVVALGRTGTRGYIINDGPGDFTVSFSFDGAIFGGEHTLKSGEILLFKNNTTDTIRITHVTDSAYRVSVI